jgi:ATP synthase I chain
MMPEVEQSLDARIFRNMAVVSGLAVIVSVFLGPWRVTTGLLIGGVLALYSHRWLKTSARAAIRLAIGGGPPKIRLAQFILRYFVVATVVFAAYEFRIASLIAMLAGLSSFVLALFVEALREFYFAIIQREEIS